MNSLVEELKPTLGGASLDTEIYEEIRKSLNLPKFMMYSSHDAQIAPAWQFLDPVEYWWDYIPFASYI